MGRRAWKLRLEIREGSKAYSTARRRLNAPRCSNVEVRRAQKNRSAYPSWRASQISARCTRYRRSA